MVRGSEFYRSFFGVGGGGGGGVLTFLDTPINGPLYRPTIKQMVNGSACSIELQLHVGGCQA